MCRTPPRGKAAHLADGAGRDPANPPGGLGDQVSPLANLDDTPSRRSAWEDANEVSNAEHAWFASPMRDQDFQSAALQREATAALAASPTTAAAAAAANAAAGGGLSPDQGGRNKVVTALDFSQELRRSVGQAPSEAVPQMQVRRRATCRRPPSAACHQLPPSPPSTSHPSPTTHHHHYRHRQVTPTGPSELPRAAGIGDEDACSDDESVHEDNYDVVS